MALLDRWQRFFKPKPTFIWTGRPMGHRYHRLALHQYRNYPDHWHALCGDYVQYEQIGKKPPSNRQLCPRCKSHPKYNDPVPRVRHYY